MFSAKFRIITSSTISALL